MPSPKGRWAGDARDDTLAAAGDRDARLSTIDGLRGVAAISVVWFHLTRVGFRFAPLAPLELSGRYGWLGVEVFFVISGFVIPWSLHRAGYAPRSFLRFVARRVVRLDPPYLASLGLVLAIAWAGPLLPPASTVGNVTAADVALHLGYANLLVGERWLNPVYWTLAIELQWYLLAGVIYGAITSRRGWLRRITIVLLAAASFVPNLPHTPRSGMIFPFLGFFVMGVATFHRRTGKLGRAEMLLMIGAGAAVSTYRVGFVAALAAMGTALIIAEVDVRPRPLLWLGELSYSLYLVHVPVATPFIRYAIAHHVAPAGRVALLAAALAVSIVVAKGLASLIEEPSRRLAARIGYRGRRSSVAVRSGDRLTPVVALEVPT